MSLGHGASIVRDGLVFQYDMANTAKSWKGKPTTNIAYYNGTWQTDVSNLSTTSVTFTDAGNERWNVSCTTAGPFRLRFALAYLTNGQTYCISYKYRLGTATAFTVTDWCDTSITKTETVIDDYVYVQAYGTRATYDSTYRFMDFSITGDGGTVEVWDIQLEEGNFATPFVKGVRSNTQALLDISKSGNTVTASNLTYNSDNTFEFNGSVNYASISSLISNGLPYTILMWVKPDTLGTSAYNSSTDRRTPLKGNGQWNPGIWVTQNTIRSHATTEYRDNQINWSDLRASMIGMTFDGTTVNNIFDGEKLTGVRTSYAPGVPSTIIIGSEATSSSIYAWDGKIFSVMFYNRVLSSQEITQNFNAYRNRYGV